MFGIEKHMPYIISILEGNQKLKNDPEIERLVQNAKSMRAKKYEEEERKKMELSKKEKKSMEVERNKIDLIPKKEPAVMESKINITQSPSIQGSPTKKFNITTPNKKLIRLEDS